MCRLKFLLNLPIIVWTIVGVILFFIMIYSAFFVDKGDYFYVTFYEFLQLFIIGLLAFLFTISQNNFQNKKKAIDALLTKIIMNLESNCILIDSQEKIHKVTVLQRKVNNELNLLKNCSQELNNSEDMKYCCTEFKNYWDTVSDYIQDIEELKKKKIELESYINNVITKLEKIQMDMYK